MQLARDDGSAAARPVVSAGHADKHCAGVPARSPRAEARAVRHHRRLDPEKCSIEYLPLVRRLAVSLKRLLPGPIELDDLVQFGLLEAAGGYRGVPEKFQDIVVVRIRGADPFAVLQKRSTVAFLLLAMSDLSTRDQLMLRLRYWGALKRDAIGALYGVSGSRVCQRVRRAVASLRKCAQK